MRNSSLVESFCAENVTGLKLSTEAVDPIFDRVVEERCALGRRSTVRTAGRSTSENAGMSSEKERENRSGRKPKVS